MYFQAVELLEYGSFLSQLEPSMYEHKFNDHNVGKAECNLFVFHVPNHWNESDLMECFVKAAGYVTVDNPTGTQLGGGDGENTQQQFYRQRALDELDNVISMKIVKSGNGESKGYAFVSYRDAHVAERAIERMHGRF